MGHILLLLIGRKKFSRKRVIQTPDLKTLYYVNGQINEFDSEKKTTKKEEDYPVSFKKSAVYRLDVSHHHHRRRLSSKYLVNIK